MSLKYQIVLLNDSGLEIYRSDPKEAEVQEDICEQVRHTLYGDSIDLNLGDSIQIQEMPS